MSFCQITIKKVNMELPIYFYKEFIYLFESVNSDLSINTYFGYLHTQQRWTKFILLSDSHCLQNLFKNGHVSLAQYCPNVGCIMNAWQGSKGLRRFCYGIGTCLNLHKYVLDGQTKICMALTTLITHTRPVNLLRLLDKPKSANSLFSSHPMI